MPKSLSNLEKLRYTRYISQSNFTKKHGKMVAKIGGKERAIYRSQKGLFYIKNGKRQYIRVL